MLNNFVHVKPLYLESENNIARETKAGIYVDTTWNPEAHTKRLGIVLDVPDTIIYHGYQYHKEVKKSEANKNKGWMESALNQTNTYDVPLELKKGDIVYFSYMAELMAKQDGLRTDEGLLIKYMNLFCRVRGVEASQYAEKGEGGVIYPLNGLMLVEPLKRDDWHKFEKDFANQMGGQYIPGEGIVRYQGCLVKDYFYPHGDKTPIQADEDIINVGDRIKYNPTSVNGIQDNLYIRDKRINKLVRLHRKDVYAVT